MIKIVNMAEKEPRTRISMRIARTRLQGGNGTLQASSVVLTIPRAFTKAYDLLEPTNVILKATNEGILVSKLKLELPK